MRPLLLVALAVASAVDAQPVPVETVSVLVLDREATTVTAPASPPGDSVRARRITAGERLLLVAGTVGGGFGSAVLIGSLAPAGSVAGLYLTGRALGLDASFRSVLGDAAWGAAAGLAAGYATLGYFTLIEGQPADLGVGLYSLGAGLLVGSVTAALLYDAAPVALVAPTGETVPGLALRVGL